MSSQPKKLTIVEAIAEVQKGDMSANDLYSQLPEQLREMLDYCSNQMNNKSFGQLSSARQFDILGRT